MESTNITRIRELAKQRAALGRQLSAVEYRGNVRDYYRQRMQIKKQMEPIDSEIASIRENLHGRNKSGHMTLSTACTLKATMKRR